MSRTDTAVRVISASPDRGVRRADRPQSGCRVATAGRDDRPVRALRCASRRVLPTGPDLRGPRRPRAGSPPSPPLEADEARLHGLGVLGGPCDGGPLEAAAATTPRSRRDGRSSASSSLTTSPRSLAARRPGRSRCAAQLPHPAGEPLVRLRRRAGETPLWFYILREASARHHGDRLGEVGGLIVGEVLVGIIDADPESFRGARADWRPTLPSAEPGRYRLIDLLPAPELAADAT